MQSATVDDCAAGNHRLCVKDFKTGIVYLVDTGANVSVIPVSKVKTKQKKECTYKLYAANNSEIKTYGVVTLELNLGLRRGYKWSFIVCDVKQPIIGADFLKAHHLVVDLHNRKLIDGLTKISKEATVVKCSDSSISSIQQDNPYKDLLGEFSEITKPVSYIEPPSHNTYHHIETTGPPVFTRARQLPPHRYKLVQEEFRLMQELGICRPSKSPWASALHIVPKKDGQIRPCGDYRALNAISKPDRYPIPRLQDFTYGLAGKKTFARLDINRAYHNICVAPQDVEKTAIITPFGLFEFPRMSFGLRNAAQTFQRFMNNTVLQGLEYLKEEQEGDSSYLFCYIDDVIIASTSAELLRKHLRLVFSKFEQFGITINLAKCCFGKSQIEFLGYSVSSEGIKPLKDKVEAIQSYPRPETVEQLRRFLGMVNFYRLHIKQAAEHQAELNKFLHGAKKKDKSKITWDEKATAAFEQCKASLQSAITLAHPDNRGKLSLMCDASNTCVGAVLQQGAPGETKPLGYFSKRLSEAQQKYSTYDRELLAVYLAVVHFRNMIEGREITIFTDHKPLTYAFSKIGTDRETPRRTRQLLYISEFTSDIQYVNGNENPVADALTRVEAIVYPTPIDFDEVARAQETDDQMARMLTELQGNIVLKQIHSPLCNKAIYCDISDSQVRPYLPQQFRKIAFDSIHNTSHPGIRATRRMITRRFFWPEMNKDVTRWARACIHCQKVKVHRHTVSKLGSFPVTERFQQLHVDIIGPLATSQEGYQYCVTMIDRFTRWPEAIPVADITADTVAKAIYEGWVCRFGCPLTITSDQGRQFESEVFKSLLNILGIKKTRTTAYHPQANGMVERMHRSLKTAIKARLRDNRSWVDELPTVLLGLRAVCKGDESVSSAELVLGQTLRLPGDFYCETEKTQVDHLPTFVSKLRSIINSLRPQSRENSDSRKIFIHKDLNTCSHVFVRNDMVKSPLIPSYSGPYEVISRDKKTFCIQMGDRQSIISIDRLKPAYIISEEKPPENSCTKNKQRESNIGSGEQKTLPPMAKTTRCGRVIKQPVRFLLT